MILAASIALALLPSLAWLALFLREDVHPEPNRLVMKAFFAGAVSVVPTLILELGAACLILGCPHSKASLIETVIPGIPSNTVIWIHFLVGVAFIEELLKFAFVKWWVLGNADFDEPVDALLYLVIGALGFAAVENVFIVTNTGIQAIGLLGPGGVLTVLGARFLSATLLHALASGIIGYTVARALFQKKTHPGQILWGLVLATFIHGVYDKLIQNITASQVTNPFPLFLLLVGLLGMTAVVLWVMLQKLRADSRAHAWRHSGTVFTQII